MPFAEGEGKFWLAEARAISRERLETYLLLLSPILLFVISLVGMRGLQSDTYVPQFG